MTGRLRSAAEQDGGFTITELLVAMSLLLVVGSMAMSAVVAVTRSTAAARATNDDIGQSTLALDRTTQLLRSAVKLEPLTASSPYRSAFTTARPRELVFYSNHRRTGTAGPDRVRFMVEADGQLVEEITPAGGTSPNWTYTTTPRRRVLARGLTSTDVFTFFTLSADRQTVVALTPGTTGLSDPQRDQLAAVGIAVSVRQPGSSSNRPVVVSTRVRMPNLALNL